MSNNIISRLKKVFKNWPDNYFYIMEDQCDNNKLRLHYHNHEIKIEHAEKIGMIFVNHYWSKRDKPILFSKPFNDKDKDIVGVIENYIIASS